MLSTWSESCKPCITRVTGHVHCMSQNVRYSLSSNTMARRTVASQI